jgi:hypothetical protein
MSLTSRRRRHVAADHYRDRGLLTEIDGGGKHDDVLAALLERLDVVGSERPAAAS